VDKGFDLFSGGWFLFGHGKEKNYEG